MKLLNLKLHSTMRLAIVITGKAKHTQRWQYPMEAIREIVMNMIVHRDYRDEADSIIKIFDDSIEFFNPGRLPENITEKDLIENTYRSTPRNKLIADIFRSMGLIEKYGSGIKRIMSYFSEAGLPKPTFQNQSNGFLVTVLANPTTKNVKIENVTENVTEKRLNQIIQLFKNNPSITTELIAEKLNVTRRTILRDLEKLKKSGKVVYAGSQKKGYWQILKNS